MIFLDTNIILRFVLDDDPILSPKAKTIIEKVTRGKTKIFVSLLTVSEIIFTLERFYKYSKSEIVKNISEFSQLTNINFENRVLVEEAFFYYVNKNVSFVDAYQIALMNKKKVKEIYSFDEDFDKFPQIERLES